MAARAVLSNELDPKARLQKQMDEAWLADLALIRELTRQEQQAEEDRLFAAQLAGVEIDPESDERRRMAMLLDDYDDDDNNEDAGRSKATQITPSVMFGMPGTVFTNNRANPFAPNLVQLTTTASSSTTVKPKKCTACMDETMRNDPCVPCNHPYHVSCLQELFMTATKDESLMPPRCCSIEIPVHLARLDHEQKRLFDSKHLEYTTVNRLYCHRPKCSAFIPPSSIKYNVGTCPKMNCQAQTCSICKAERHVNSECPKDTDTTALLDTAREAGWTRCYRCGVLVELTIGCYHMTCRCRAEFCYVCSKPWKNCPCPQWDEHRLLTEARVRTARILENEPGPRVRMPEFNQYVHRVVNELRDNAECRHRGRWICVQGAGRCEECHHFLPQYLFRCCGCQLMACNRCRRNRF